MRLGGAGRDGTPRGGRRTDYRVACLFGDEVVSPNETCIVPRAWFDQRWDTEAFGNTRHPCCDKLRARSDYSLGQLMKLSAAEPHLRFHFLRGASAAVVRREPSVAALQRGSGGNAILAALALCDHVRVYGSGLYSSSPTADKRYVHFYDEAGVGHCGGHNRSDEWDGGPGYLWQKRNILHQWRKDRLRQELFLHLMHSLGIVQWRQ